MKPETEKWLEKAEKDLEDGVFNYENERDEVAGFLLQQAVEKALKALQIERTGEHEFEHNLVELSRDLVPSRFDKLMAELTPVYTGFRYPDVDFELENLGDLKERTEELLKWIKKQLKK